MRIPRPSILLTRPTPVTRGGVDFTSGAQIIRKTAETQAVNNSTTLVNDDALLAALAANETVYFAVHIVHIGNSTADFKAAFTVPAVATILWSPPNGYINAAGSLAADAVNSSGAALSFQGSTVDIGQLMVGVVRNSTTAGNLQLQWAQDTATVVDTKVLTDSFLMVWRA